MKFIRSNQTNKFKNSNSCLAIEYPMGDTDINGAVVKLNGRYPDKGRVVNLKCKELSYIVQGSGRVNIEDKDIFLKQGDLVLIEPNEKYYWEGKMTMFMPCTPAWYPEQHQVIK